MSVNLATGVVSGGHAARTPWPMQRHALRLPEQLRAGRGLGTRRHPHRRQWTARATQVGEHLHIMLDGGDLYLAWTTLDDLAGQDVLI